MSATAAPAHARSYLLIVMVLASASALSNLSSFSFMPSVVSIGKSLESSTAAIQSTVFIYQWLFAVVTLFAGFIADRYNKCGVLLVGSGMVLVAGLGVAASQSYGMFLLWRCVQAVGAATAFVCARAVAADVVDRSWLVTAMAWVAGAASISSMAGPAVGGLVEQTLNWRYTFAIIAVYSGAVMFALWRLILPLKLTPQKQSAAEAADVTRAGRWRELVPSMAVVRCSCAIGMCSFSFHLFMTSAPLLLPRLYGYTPAEVGTAMISPTIGFMCGVPLASMLVRRSRRPVDVLMRIEMCVLAFWGGAMAVGAALGTPAVLLCVLAGLVGFSNAFVIPMGFASVTLLESGKAGSVSGVLGFSQFIIAGIAGLLAIVITRHDFVWLGVAISVGGLLAIVLVPRFPRGARLGGRA